MKITIIIFLSVVSSMFIKAQDVIREGIHGSTAKNTSSIRYSIGQPIAPKGHAAFLYGFQAPIMVRIDKKFAIDVVIYPNPLQETLFIETPSLNYNYTIHSIKGELVKKGTLIRKQNKLNIQELPLGIYSLLIFDGTNSLKGHFKILKE